MTDLQLLHAPSTTDGWQTVRELKTPNSSLLQLWADTWNSPEDETNLW